MLPGQWTLCLSLSIAWLVGILPAAAEEPALEGRETTLAPSVSGYVVRTRNHREIVALQLPALKERVVARTVGQARLHAVGGPDDEGRVAWLENHVAANPASPKQHVLKIVSLDGTQEQEVFRRPARDAVGTHLALAPSRGRVALLSQLSMRPLPGKEFQEGRLEIWDLATKTQLEPTVRALDQPLSWFADGRRLAYTRLIPREDLPAEAVGLERFGQFRGHEWDELPAIFMLDAETGESRLLHVGWTPIVSASGEEVLVGGWDRSGVFSWNRLTLASGKSTPVEWPGNVGGAIALPADQIVLYAGQPAMNRRPATDRVSQPRSWLTLKLARLNSNDFQTIVARHDERDFVSFGRIARDRPSQ